MPQYGNNTRDLSLILSRRLALARLDSTAAATATTAYGLWPGQNQARTASLCWLLATDYVQLATATASATAIATLGS